MTRWGPSSAAVLLVIKHLLQFHCLHRIFGRVQFNKHFIKSAMEHTQILCVWWWKVSFCSNTSRSLAKKRCFYRFNLYAMLKLEFANDIHSLTAERCAQSGKIRLWTEPRRVLVKQSEIAQIDFYTRWTMRSEQILAWMKDIGDGKQTAGRERERTRCRATSMSKSCGVTWCDGERKVNQTKIKLTNEIWRRVKAAVRDTNRRLQKNRNIDWAM